MNDVEPVEGSGFGRNCVYLLSLFISIRTCLPVSICSHTQELTHYELLNMSIISLNSTNLPFLSWSHSSAH